MSKLDPKNREEAFTYQLEDDIKLLRASSAFINSRDFSVTSKPFYDALENLKGHIKLLEQLKYK